MATSTRWLTTGVPLLLVEAQQALIRSEATQRKLAEQQLAILDAFPAHIALIDGEGVILAVNDAWRRFTHPNVLKADPHQRWFRDRLAAVAAALAPARLRW